MKRILQFLFVFRPAIHAQDEAAYSAIAGQQFVGWLVRRVMLCAAIAGGIAAWVVVSQAVR
jgi:hypothetical protein